MNVRIDAEPTPARRLAALLRTYLNHFIRPPNPTPDYADIAADIERYTLREEFRARLEELHQTIAASGVRMGSNLVSINTSAQEIRLHEYFHRRIQILTAQMQANEQAIEQDRLHRRMFGEL